MSDLVLHLFLFINLNPTGQQCLCSAFHGPCSHRSHRYVIHAMQPSGVRIHVAESGQVRQSIGSNDNVIRRVCDGDGDPSVKKCDKIQMTDSVHGVGLGVERGSSLRTARNSWKWTFFIMGRSPGNENF